MANGDLEIPKPLSNHNNHTTSINCEPKSTSNTNNMEGTVEFRVMMAYAQRRRPTKDIESPTQEGPGTPDSVAPPNEPSSPQTPAETEKERKKGKKKKALKRLSKIFQCLKPQIQDDEPPPTPVDRSFSAGRNPVVIPSLVKEEEEFDKVAHRLTQIANEIPFTPPEIEEDSPSHDENVEKIIGLILREAGDKLNEEELKNASIDMRLFMNYDFFKNVMTALLRRMGLINSEPDALGPQASPKTQIAVTCEVTNRLSGLNTHPMSRMLDHGARYLQEYYSSWIEQQDGYEEAFKDEDEDEVH